MQGPRSRTLDADDLDFTVAPDELPEARAQLLHEAAGHLDTRDAVLGGGRDGDDGNIARSLAEDDAKLQRPEVYRIEDERLEEFRADVPVTVADYARLWRFYWLSFPISLWASQGRGFNQIQVKFDFNPEDPEERRPRTIDALPEQAFVTRFKSESSLQIGLGADLKFKAAIPVLGGSIGGAGVEVGGGAGGSAVAATTLVVGPFGYEVRVPKVKRSNLGLDHVRWRIDDAKLVDEQDPGLRAVLRIPRDEPRLVVHAQLRARRYFNLFDNTFQGAMIALPDKLKAIFTGGAPIGHTPDAWDLTPEL